MTTEDNQNYNETMARKICELCDGIADLRATSKESIKLLREIADTLNDIKHLSVKDD